jgi:formylglycine-generating enzyme required for sulfatase activity
MLVRTSLALLVAAVTIFASVARSAEPAAAAPGKMPATRSVPITIAASEFGRGRSASVVNIDLVRIPAGRITLTGKDGVAREHEIKPVWIGRTEVIWEQYDVFWQMLDLSSPWADRNERINKAVRERSRPSKPYEPPDRGWGHDGFPAITLTFEAADTYCTWLSQQTGKKFRIPTEAEWEYACRAGGPPVKLDAKALAKVAWFDANSTVGTGKEAGLQTHRVATLAPNAWGLYDMLGNAAEYVIVDEKTREWRVAGGSFQDEEADVHSGARQAYSKAWQKDDPQEPKGRSWLSNGVHVGLRVVMEE